MKKNYVGLLKFGQKEHMDAFFGNGELYLNTFDYFKNLEDIGDGRADSCEYLFSLYSGTGVENLQLTITPSDGKAFKPIVLNKNSIASVKLDCSDKKYSHLFCLSAVDVDWTQQNKQLVDRRNVANGKDWVVFIKNPNALTPDELHTINNAKYQRMFASDDTLAALDKVDNLTGTVKGYYNQGKTAVIDVVKHPIQAGKNVWNAAKGKVTKENAEILWNSVKNAYNKNIKGHKISEVGSKLTGQAKTILTELQNGSSTHCLYR